MSVTLSFCNEGLHRGILFAGA